MQNEYKVEEEDKIHYCSTTGLNCLYAKNELFVCLSEHFVCPIEQFVCQK